MIQCIGLDISPCAKMGVPPPLMPYAALSKQNQSTVVMGQIYDQQGVRQWEVPHPQHPYTALSKQDQSTEAVTRSRISHKQGVRQTLSFRTCPTSCRKSQIKSYFLTSKLSGQPIKKPLPLIIDGNLDHGFPLCPRVFCFYLFVCLFVFFLTVSRLLHCIRFSTSLCLFKGTRHNLYFKFPVSQQLLIFLRIQRPISCTVLNIFSAREPNICNYFNR